MASRSGNKVFRIAIFPAAGQLRPSHYEICIPTTRQGIEAFATAFVREVLRHAGRASLRAAVRLLVRLSLGRRRPLP